MIKFKLTKEITDFDRIRWHYRDFIIQDVRCSSSPYSDWRVFNQDVGISPLTNKPKIYRGKQVYECGNGTRKAMMEWVDEYYQEMDDFTNSQEFNEMGGN